MSGDVCVSLCLGVHLCIRADVSLCPPDCVYMCSCLSVGHGICRVCVSVDQCTCVCVCVSECGSVSLCVCVCLSVDLCVSVGQCICPVCVCVVWVTVFVRVCTYLCLSVYLCYGLESLGLPNLWCICGSVSRRVCPCMSLLPADAHAISPPSSDRAVALLGSLDFCPCLPHTLARLGLTLPVSRKLG